MQAKSATLLVLSLLIVTLGGTVTWLHLRAPTSSPEQAEKKQQENTASFVPKALRPQTQPTNKSMGLDSAYGKFQTGDYTTAILLLREALAKNPADALTKKNLATSLFALGLQRLQEQKLSEAADLLEEAARLGHPQASPALARLRIRLGEIPLAITVLEEIYWKSRDLNAAWALIDLALSKDDLPAAQAWLNRVEDNLEKMPPDGDVKKDQEMLNETRKKLTVRSAFQKDEIVLEEGNLQVAFLAAEKKPIAEAVLKAMSEAEENYSQNFGSVAEHVQFRAAIIPSSDFRDNTGAPPWAQAIFDGIIRIPVPIGPATKRDAARAATNARHEMLHAWLSALCGEAIPSWLGEGLAQKQELRPLSQSVAALRLKLGATLPSTMPSDPWFDKLFYEAPQDLISELYSRSHLLAEAIERQHGNRIWRSIFLKSCINKDPLNAALNEELGAFTPQELWQRHQIPIVGIFTNKK
jgi:tetratricopeptide (TPR) repeat protein